MLLLSWSADRTVGVLIGLSACSVENFSLYEFGMLQKIGISRNDPLLFESEILDRNI